VSRDIVEDAPRTLVPRGSTGIWSPDGRSVLTVIVEGPDQGSLGIVPAAGGAPRLVVSSRNLSAEFLSRYDWSEDGRFIYYLRRDPAHRSAGIWRIPAAGGAARLVVQFDTPSRPAGVGFRVRGGQFYFTLSDQQSDIWITDVVGSR
jgi:hypothetical protein